MKNLEKILKKHPIAFIPVLVKDKGRATKIITKDLEEIYVSNRIGTVLKKMAVNELIDLEAVKKVVGDISGCKRLAPIILGGENIYIPIKVRKPICTNDPCYGYFNTKYIKNYKKKDKKTIIILKGDIKIEVNQTIKTITKYINVGKILRDYYYKTPFIKEDKTEDDNIYKEFNKPATKLDIAILRNDILNMKKEIISLKDNDR
ncbi:MAG: hypothetical protein FH751_07365 [Firmicutes bacterium]|nr:hypothetical protein [Bacillota bacterium]